ncbi:MAG: hypothetical protein HKM95_08255 [Inquilinus sp.]|nr:hypothetical protein [Inquilinus sp.]
MTGERETLFEFRRIGRSVKVTAIDSESLTEVSFLGPANAGEAELRRIAIAKLDYVMTKNRS